MMTSMISLFEPNLNGIGVFILIMMFLAFGVPILLAIIGAIQWGRGKKRSGKILLIIAGIYILISGGLCLSMVA